MRTLGLCLASLLLAPPANAAVKIALVGETAPGSNGTFQSLAFPGLQLTETGRFFFFATTDRIVPPGTAGPECIFRYDVDGSGGTAMVCVGDSVGLPGADFWLDIGRWDVNTLGDLVFDGLYRDTVGVNQQRIFHLSSAGVLSQLAFAGATGLPPFAFGSNRVRINDANDVLLDTADSVQLSAPGASVTTVHDGLDPLPDDPTIDLEGLEAWLGPNAEIAVVFRHETPQATHDHYLFLWESGVFTRIAETLAPSGPFSGATHIDAIFTPGGRLFARPSKDVGHPIGLDGAVAIVEWDGGGWRTITTPFPGELIADVFRMDSAGQSRIAFFSAFQPPLAGAFATVWCQVAGFGRSQPVRKGDPLPGGTAFSVGPNIAISTTRWATQAQLNDANGASGLFVGRANKVPSLTLPGGAALVLLLGVWGVQRARAARPRRRGC